MTSTVLKWVSGIIRPFNGEITSDDYNYTYIILLKIISHFNHNISGRVK